MKKKKLKLSLGVLGIASLGLLAACSSNGTAETKEDQLSIVTTFYPMYEFTKEIVGDEAKVELLVPAGSEPHDYEPSAKDMAKIQSADVFVYHNPNMEGWVEKVQKTLEDDQVNVIEGTKGMLLLPGSEEEDHDHGEEGHHHELDPHTWLAPSLAKKEVESIEQQLAKAYPDKAKVFKTNSEAYLEKLNALDQLYQKSLTNAPQKSFVTQHAAFGYLALEYGLTQVPIAGLSPEIEPSPKRLAELKTYVKDNDIQYIYFEENASDKVAKTLANETGVDLLVLNPLESLTNQQLKAGETYISVMEENLKALEKTTQSASKEVTTETATQTEKTVANGYFEDSEVEDRTLANYAGNWQSVYPYLQDGTLDQVFSYKAKLNPEKTEAEYKAYYETGYKTDVDQIKITDDTISFSDPAGTKTYTYTYAGKEILTYAKGNKGVRYLFETNDPNAGNYRYVQFSDHGIKDEAAVHFHIYFGGESQQALLTEMDHWPTYYPADLSATQIAQEMLAH